LRGPPATFSGSGALAVPATLTVGETKMNALFGFLGGIGPLELFIVAVILLLLFGNRLPGVMRSLGRGVIEFKKGVQGIDEESDEKSESKP
jgi:sec-independent protein translocase protein TatA